jgi:prefoldin subunit 5
LDGFVLTTEASLDKVYAEVKRVRVKLESIEKTLESLKESMIPEEEVSPEELKELKALEREAKKHPERLIPLEDVLKKHGAKKRA